MSETIEKIASKTVDVSTTIQQNESKNIKWDQKIFPHLYPQSTRKMKIIEHSVWGK